MNKKLLYTAIFIGGAVISSLSLAYIIKENYNYEKSRDTGKKNEKYETLARITLLSGLAGSLISGNKLEKLIK